MKLKSIEYRNFWAVGSSPVTINLDEPQMNVLTGANGSGKCLSKFTTLEVKNDGSEAAKKFEQFIKNRKNT